MKWPIVLLVLLALLVSAPSLSGQETSPISPGTRLRVTVADPRLEVRVGEYRSLADGILALETRAGLEELPLRTVTRLEASAGTRPGLAGGIVGFVLGAGVGGAVGCAANRDSYGVFCLGQDDTKVFVGAAIGAAAGAFLGAQLFRRESWREVDPARLDYGASPTTASASISTR